MKIKLQGLNFFKKSCDRFEIVDIVDDDNKDNLSIEKMYFTFNDIYIVKEINQNLAPLIYDQILACFQLLDAAANLRLISFCANTNYFWCLVYEKNENEDAKFYLFQYSSKILLKKIELNKLDLSVPTWLFKQLM